MQISAGVRCYSRPDLKQQNISVILYSPKHAIRLEQIKEWGNSLHFCGRNNKVTWLLVKIQTSALHILNKVDIPWALDVPIQSSLLRLCPAGTGLSVAAHTDSVS